MKTIPNGMLELFKLYTFIDKLSIPIAVLINDDPSRACYTLESSDNMALFIQHSENKYYLKLITIINGKEFSLNVKLGNTGHPIDKRVINEIRCALHKQFNGLSPKLYTNELYRTVRSELISILNRTFIGSGKIGFPKTDTACIDLHVPFGVLMDVEVRTTCKFKVVRAGLDVVLKRRVYNMNIDEYHMSATGEYTAELTRNIINQLRKIDALC